MLHKDISAEELPRSIIGHPDLKTLLERLKSGRLGDRLRSIAILANKRGLQIGSICDALNLSRQSYRRYVRLFDEGGAATLFMATWLGVPVSTTHTITGAIVGVGAARRVSAVRWNVASSIVYAWVITIPAAAGIAALAYWAVALVR